MSRKPFRGARRFFLIALGVLVALAATGSLYQTLSVRRWSARFPPPGTLVDVGGRRLHLMCTGQGTPTVVFESSGFGSSRSFDEVRAEVGAQTQACSYDRMGMAWSDAGDAVISAGLLADDLERLLERARLPPPYILVPASIGGLTVELFARRHPEQIAGLVFVDAAQSSAVERFAPRINFLETEAACLATTAARLGMLRLFDPFGLRRLPPETAAQAMAVIYRVEPMATLCGLARGIPKSAQELAAAPPLKPDIPLAVLGAETSVGLVPPGLESWVEASAPERRELQRRFAERSTRGTFRVVPGSGHLIASTHPHEVAAVVLDMLAEIRRN